MGTLFGLQLRRLSGEVTPFVVARGPRSDLWFPFSGCSCAAVLGKPPFLGRLTALSSELWARLSGCSSAVVLVKPRSFMAAHGLEL